MTKIKSLEELTQLRDKIKSNSSNENSVKVLVSMATCGIAAGAKDTMSAISDEIAKLGLSGIDVIPCGCMGMCYVEPTVEVVINGKENVLYGNVSPEQAREIVEKHLKNSELVKNLIVEKPY